MVKSTLGVVKMAQKDKTALEKLIKNLDVLDFDNLTIDRKLSSSQKKTKATTFNKSVTDSIEDERDLLLIAIKLK